MLATHPDIYAAQRHHVQAVEPPSWDIIAPPFTRGCSSLSSTPQRSHKAIHSDMWAEDYSAVDWLKAACLGGQHCEAMT